ncbi:octapeptide-repeat protein T2-like [Watersipora subatra]|uniref:octapeptide-repeat protein T2-like n=1 Tax=Watersipora subatra TaxID=2589382 RepID=UPI00355BF9BF
MESGFPKLVFGEHGDGSWERFIEEMNLCIESAVERRDYEGEGGDRRPIMRGRGRSSPRGSPRGSPRSGREYYGSEERDTGRYGTRGREYNKDSDSRKDRREVGYDRRGSSRRSGGSRDNSNERYGSRDSSRERYRGRESPHEIRDKFGRYKDNSMDRFEGEKYKERRARSQYEGYQDSSKGRSVRFSGSRDKYEDDS